MSYALLYLIRNTFLLFSFWWNVTLDMFCWDLAISRDWSESVLQKSLSLEQTVLQWVETCLSLWEANNYCELWEVLTMLCKDSSLTRLATCLGHFRLTFRVTTGLFCWTLNGENKHLGADSFTVFSQGELAYETNILGNILSRETSEGINVFVAGPCCNPAPTEWFSGEVF